MTLFQAGVWNKFKEEVRYAISGRTDLYKAKNGRAEEHGESNIRGEHAVADLER